MARFKSLEWYKLHPEIIVRHHKERWTDLQIHVLLLLFKNEETLHEMTRMLGRTEYGVLSQLERQKLIWCDASGRIGQRYAYYLRSFPSGRRSYNTPQSYNGKR